MPRHFTEMSPQARDAFIDEQVDAFRNRAKSPVAPANPENTIVPDVATPPQDQVPRKKPKTRRPRPVTAAKNVLRAAKVLPSKSLAPGFIHHSPNFARHRRKCVVCHHPERETIEDLFIHWHSPNSIAEYYNDDGEGDLTWVSIYRHAYAVGLDEIRRRNLRFAFEHIVDQAGDVNATSAAIFAAARALGACINENGQWNEPPKRVVVTNISKTEQDKSAEQPGKSAEADSSDRRAGCEKSALAGAPSGVHSSSFAGAPSAKGGIAEDHAADSLSADEIRVPPNLLITNGT